MDNTAHRSPVATSRGRRGGETSPPPVWGAFLPAAAATALEASAPGGLDPLMQRGFSERLCGLCRAGLCRPGTHTAKRRRRTHARAEPRHTARRESHAAALFSVTKRGLDFSAPTRGELKKTC